MRRGTSLVLIIVVEPCGSVLSSRIYPTNEGPHFIKGQSVCAAFIFSTTFLAFTLSFLLIRNNMQLGRKQGDVVDRDQRRVPPQLRTMVLISSTYYKAGRCVRHTKKISRSAIYG